MTVRDAFEYCLIELNKSQAPSLLVEDFVYLFNKSIQQYINLRYNKYEITQQLTDDLRVLNKSIKIEAEKLQQIDDSFNSSYKCTLPNDYLHLLNCICQFTDLKQKCGNNKSIIRGANKLDTTQWPHVIENYYMQPSVNRPYYYMVNSDDPQSVTKTPDSEREGNSSIPTMQIKYGNNPRYKLKTLYIDYLRAPKRINLTRADLNKLKDETDELEFPDYVIYEILNKMVSLILENTSNPRVQSHTVINTSIPA